MSASTQSCGAGLFGAHIKIEVDVIMPEANHVMVIKTPNRTRQKVT